MNKILCPIAVLLLLSILSVPVTADSARDVLYQVSTIDSLMAGLFDGWASIDQLMKHGDFGLGTFNRLDGEMVVMDGIAYQITSDGIAHKPTANVTTPFAAVTFFDKDKAVTIPNEMTLPKLQEYLDSLLPSKNLFYAIRIDGTFTQVKTRSVPIQSKPYPHLVDVTAKQPVFELTNVSGTIVALRCPYFVKGVNVPGYHMHFITSDRKRGGHLLDCNMKSGVAVIDITPEFNLSLPKDESFYHADFEASNQEDLKKVEQGNR
ncbi:MAG: acetolactate decarboxylase [Armatimonadota bacterium]|nr:acetolactate decarboxylase [bacterium]